MYKPWSAGPAPAPDPPLDRPVWVNLEQLYGAPDETAADTVDPAPDGWLNLSGRVPGVLKRWLRSTDGRWLARVDFAVCDDYGAVQVRHEGALVPAAALSPIVEMEPRR